MKNLLFMFVLLPFIGKAEASLAGITDAISKGNASELSEFFDQNVEIAVLEDEDVYNKAQALSIIKTPQNGTT